MTIPGRPSAVLAGLKTPLAKLRSVALLGKAPLRNLDLESTIDGSIGNFFRAHPHIEKVTMKWYPRHQTLERINPLLIASLFPALKSFFGPIRVCIALVASELRHQLVALGARNNALTNDEAENSLSELAATARLLPNLKHFEISKFDSKILSRIKINSETLLQILAATPALVWLNINCVSVEWVSRRIVVTS